VIANENFLCLRCIHDLPVTNFAMHANNPLEKKFWGRLSLASAMSELYFSKDSIVQNMIHEFKYRGNKKAGHYFGKMIGRSLLNSIRFDIDLIVPLPLFIRKEKMRGFNQAEILCNGIAEVINKPVVTRNVTRKIFTESQTKKHRIERWQNVEGIFYINYPKALEGKHILLVDDVVTTGATLEACGADILKVTGTTLSVATLAMAAS
jgi:ComF family protein